MISSVLLLILSVSSCASKKTLQYKELPSHNFIQFYFPDISVDSQIDEFLKGNPVDRFGLRSESFLTYLKKLDENESYSFYIPTLKDRALIRDAIAKLPYLVKENLKKRVIAVYFINNFASTGYTEWAANPDGGIYTVIAINSDVFKMNASEIINRRESTCYKNDSSSVQIKIKAGGNESALLYILLHEAVHAADYSLRISDIDDEFYNTKKMKIKRMYIPEDQYWENQNKPFAKYDFQNRDLLSFYGFRKGPHLSRDSAPELYESLAKSPFTSLYGSQYRMEDLAEIVTMYQLTRVMGYPYEIEIHDSKSKEKHIFRPMEFPEVQKRTEGIKFFYDAPEKEQKP